MAAMLLLTLLLFLAGEGLCIQQSQRLHKKTINMTSVLWESSLKDQRYLPSKIQCAGACLIQKHTCNSFKFYEVTKLCEMANLTALEDPDPTMPPFDIFVDVDLIKQIPQVCKGGEGCCYERGTNRTTFCKLGEGDCDSDAGCSPGTNCGEDNCISDFGHSGDLWDSTDDCCAANCSSAKPCANAEGMCESVAGCFNSSWTWCTQCIDEAMFPKEVYTDLHALGYPPNYNCCRRYCVPHKQCAFEEVGCNTDEDCLLGYRCVMVEDKPTCMDLDECQNNPCTTEETCYNKIGSYKCIKKSEENVLLVMSGWYENTYTQVIRDDLTVCNNSQHKIPPLYDYSNNYRYHARYGAAAYSNGIILLCGGQITEYKSVGTCWSLSVFEENPTWQYHSTMLTKRSRHTMVAHNDMFVVIAGYNSLGEEVDSVDAKKPTSGWYSLDRYPRRVQEHCSLSAYPDEDSIYTLGGYDGKATDLIFKLNMVKDDWVHVGYLPFGLKKLGCAWVNRLSDDHKLLVVFGGISDITRTRQAFYWDFTTNQKWFYVEGPSPYASQAYLVATNKYTLFMGHYAHLSTWYAWEDLSIAAIQRNKTTTSLYSSLSSGGLLERFTKSFQVPSPPDLFRAVAIPKSSPLVAGCFN